MDVDPSKVHVEQSRARIAALGPTNVALHTRNLTAVEEADRVFDYIICHGVYSWVPGRCARGL